MVLCWQECKALNGRLINFLRERSTVEKLLRYLVQNPEQPGTAAPTSDADSKQQFKYPYAACEVGPVGEGSSQKSRHARAAS